MIKHEIKATVKNVKWIRNQFGEFSGYKIFTDNGVTRIKYNDTENINKVYELLEDKRIINNMFTFEIYEEENGKTYIKKFKKGVYNEI
tara:strand:- start:312 stop:575 length:264 start_codon:yes stop_codon:yes gene_type:complete